MSIKLGPCRVTYDPDGVSYVIDKTIGGVDFSAAPLTKEIKVDQFGEGAYDHRIVGWEAKAIIRMAESDYDAIKAMSVALDETIDGAKKKLYDKQLGTSMRTLAKKLVIHPLDMGTSVEEDITVYLAAPLTPLDLKYNYKEERVLEVTMHAYPREIAGTIDPGDPNAYFCIGDESASYLQNGKLITAFSFAALVPAVSGTIDYDARTVSLTVPALTNVTALVATFTLSSGAEAYLGAVAQVSGATANNFTNPVTYRIEAEDGTSYYWFVTVTVAP